MGEDDGSERRLTQALVHFQVSELLYREGELLDAQRWDEWLELFVPDCRYWVLAWLDEHELTRDPATEVSLIYCEGRAALADRVERVRSGLSAAAMPLPRTWHMVGAIRLGERDAAGLGVSARWQSRAYRFEQTSVYYGRCEYVLAEERAGWRIRSKKIVLINDVIDTVLDFYHL